MKLSERETPRAPVRGEVAVNGNEVWKKSERRRNPSVGRVIEKKTRFRNQELDYEEEAPQGTTLRPLSYNK